MADFASETCYSLVSQGTTCRFCQQYDNPRPCKNGFSTTLLACVGINKRSPTGLTHLLGLAGPPRFLDRITLMRKCGQPVEHHPQDELHSSISNRPATRLSSSIGVASLLRKFPPICGVPVSQWSAGRSLRDQIFFLLRTALKDRPKGPPTANRQLPPTANRHQPPTAANRQLRPIANRQPLPTATNHPSPTANCRQPPPTANRQSPPAANRQSPPTMVEHMSYTRSFLKKPCSGTVFFFR